MADVATCSMAPVNLRHVHSDTARSRSSASASKRRASSRFVNQLSRLPDIIIETLLMDKLSASDLCALACVNARMRSLTNCNTRWKQLFLEQWRNITPITERASTLAGSWNALYKAKTLQDKESTPWRKLCEWELAAALEQLTAPQQLRSPGQGLAVVFLLDGSGSVQEEDFTTMTSFISSAAESIYAHAPSAQVGILQFSNDVRVELPLQRLDLDVVNGVVDGMARMNGGTNIAGSIDKAGAILKKGAPADASKVLVLITDGRVESYQAREAVATAERLKGEQAHVNLLAFGVGRDVSRKELLKIVSVTGAESAACRYVDLCVRDELPW